MRQKQIAVITAVSLGLIFVLLAGFVIDTANWFEHQRHLQAQADAGALAGATRFDECEGNQTTAAEMLELIAKIQEVARAQRGIELETEVQIVGEPA